MPGGVDAIAIEDQLTIERAILYVYGPLTAGETAGDIRINGESIYTSLGIGDSRSHLAFDAVHGQRTASMNACTSVRAMSSASGIRASRRASGG